MENSGRFLLVQSQREVEGGDRGLSGDSARPVGLLCHKQTGGWPEGGEGTGRSGAGVVLGGGWALFALLKFLLGLVFVDDYLPCIQANRPTH